MQFSTGMPFFVGPFQNRTLIGLNQTIQDPMLLSSMFPKVSEAFQFVWDEKVCDSATIQVDVQFQSKDHPTTELQVSLVKLHAVTDGVPMLSTLALELKSVSQPCVFAFKHDLATFEDDGVGYRNVWSLKHKLQGLENVKINAGERLALLLEHSNLTIESVNVHGNLKFKKPRL